MRVALLCAGLALVGVVAGFALGRWGSSGATSTVTQVATTTVVSRPGPSAADAFVEAMSRVRAVVPAMAAYWDEHRTYVGATIAALRTYDTGIGPGLKIGATGSDSFCLQATVDSQTASYRQFAGHPYVEAGWAVGGC